MDEVSQIRERRGRNAARVDPLSADKTKHKPAGTKDAAEGRTPLWRWFSTQSAHSIPERREAAIHVKARWNLPVTPFGKILRDLAAEDSPHLLAVMALLDEYRVAYNIEEDDDNFARNVGSAGQLVPIYIEICEDSVGTDRKCGREAIPGTGKCARHGGAWISTKDAADLSRRIHDRLLQASERAVRVLEDLMDNGRSEQVRSIAAAQVLDRAGIGPHMTVNHSGSIEISDTDKAADELRARLTRLHQNVTDREAQLALEQAEASGDVQEAEVVSETG